MRRKRATRALASLHSATCELQSGNTSSAAPVRLTTPTVQATHAASDCLPPTGAPIRGRRGPCPVCGSDGSRFDCCEHAMPVNCRSKLCKQWFPSPTRRPIIVVTCPPPTSEESGATARGPIKIRSDDQRHESEDQALNDDIRTPREHDSSPRYPSRTA